MSDMEKCPFCDSSRIEIEHDPHCFLGQSYLDYTTSDGYRVRCYDCACQTCWWHTRQQSIAAWNRRAEPMPERDAEVLERQGFKMLIDRDALRDKIIAEAECESVESGVMGLEVQAIQVPPGYALVPVKLTAAMTEAHRQIEDGPLRSYQEAWNLVLAAAQEERE